MSWASLGAFTVAMTALCVVPGPAVLLVVSQALSHGSAKAVWSILGITAAGTAWFVLSATGIGAALTASAELFFAIKWVGVVYLLWLGAGAFWRTSKLAAVKPDAGSAKAGRLFWGGFVLQTANPNVLLFFTAFLPQFIAPKAPLVPQLALLAAVTAVIELVVQLAYAFLAGRFRMVLAAPRFAKWTERVAGAILIAAGLAMASSVARAETAKASTYAALVAKAEAGETVDYNALRYSYPLSPDYDPYGEKSRPPFMEAWKAFEAKDCATAMAKSGASLKINYINFALHTVRGDCFEQAGDAKAAARERAVAEGLAQALIASGDGKSFATAYAVVTMGEERALLAYLGLTEKEQSLTTSDGHEYDLITGAGKDGKTMNVLFKVDALFFGQAKKLQAEGHP